MVDHNAERTYGEILSSGFREEIEHLDNVVESGDMVIGRYRALSPLQEANSWSLGITLRDFHKHEGEEFAAEFFRGVFGQDGVPYNYARLRSTLLHEPIHISYDGERRDGYLYRYQPSDLLSWRNMLRDLTNVHDVLVEAFTELDPDCEGAWSHRSSEHGVMASARLTSSGKYGGRTEEVQTTRKVIIYATEFRERKNMFGGTNIDANLSTLRYD